MGSGNFADYDGKGVAGMITLSELSFSPGRHEKQRIAALMGSTAQIMRNWGHAENASLPLGSVKPAWGNPTPETIKTEMPVIPCIGISRIDGGQLSINSRADPCMCACTPKLRMAGASCRRQSASCEP